MLKSECSVCGARRKFKSLVYDQSLNPYCSSAMNCVSFHPNSQKNYRERGTWTELLSYEEALQLQKQRTEYTYEESAHTFGKRVRTVNMHKLLTGSVSFRIQSETQADYISYILGKTGSNRITEAILFIINKIDRQDARPDEVLNEIFDLFVSLNANEQQLDFPVLYAVGRDGWCVRDMEKDERKDLSPLFDLILEHVNPPKFDSEAPFITF